jgi:hypothetical protein
MKKGKSVAKVKAGATRLSLYQHQQEADDAYTQQQLRRFYLAWHRRAGKDVFALDFTHRRMNERVGSYWHLFPFHIQAKRAIWKGIDARTGQRFIDRAFPDQRNVNDTEMSFSIPNGSSWQMLGSDNYDRMVGSNPCGVVFSEWALCDPAAWDYIRPILVENKGWAMFITTFRGRNHAWRLFETVKQLEDWFTSLRTIDDTHRGDGSPIVTQKDIDAEIAAGMDKGLVRQEFYCDPDAASAGAIFARQHQRLLQLDCRVSTPTNRVLRVAWGSYKEGISAIVFEDRFIHAVHAFQESNYTDAVQAVTRRHPAALLIHHAIDPDPTLFASLDGNGVVAAPLTQAEHMQHGHAAAILNICEATSAAREVLADFSMSYTPYREQNDEVLTHDSVAQALAVMHSAQVFTKQPPRKPIDYRQYDKGVI